MTLKVKNTLEYDANGNPTSTVISASPESNDNSKIYSSATYTSDKNYTASLTDSRGNTVRYDVNLKTGITNSVTDANGGKTVYTYDNRDRLTKVSSAKEDGSSVRLREEEVSYTYENGRLSEISVPMEWMSNVADTRKYSFVYDEFGNVLSTKFGTKTLMTNTYAPNNGKLTSSTYGNGASINYYYDNLDRIVSLRYNNNEQTAFNYTYNRFGSVSAITDTASGIAKIYDYDTVGRLISARTENGTNDVFRTHYTYDGLSRLDTLKYVYSTAAGTRYTHEYSATYGEDSRVNTFGLNGIFSITPTFDGLGRQSSRVLKNGSGAQVEKEDYAFIAGAGGNNATTTLIGSATYYGAGTTGTQYSYEYDKTGNLTAIKKNGTTLHTYTYDSLGQLTSWYNAATDKTVRYGYYKGGNLKNIYDGEDTVSFVYNNGDGIADRLMVYDGQLLSYDDIGNPLNFRDGISMTWKNGRQLATLTNGQTSASYDYDESGIRTKKTVNGVTTTFQLDGSKIVSENRNGTVQSYFYDENGSVLGITYGGENYYFRKNFRNDVLAILNASGEVVVEYSYDPWGNILAVTGTLASTLGADNPFRYRGYYYDTETGFYYVSSRYYDPEVGRYLNADGYVSTGQGILGNNMFAYCGNNPVNNCDPSGQFFISALLVGGLVLGSALLLSGCSAKPEPKPEPYKSADDAARAFSEQVYSSSAYIRHEYSTEIYSRTVKGETTYNYNPPRAGKPHSASVGNSTPKGTKAVAYAHTHPNSNVFSGADIRAAENLKIDAYVVGPNLELQRYSLSSASITNIGGISPIALTDAQRSSLVTEFQVSWDAHIAAGCDFDCGSMTWPTP